VILADSWPLFGFCGGCHGLCQVVIKNRQCIVKHIGDIALDTTQRNLTQQII